MKVNNFSNLGLNFRGYDAVPLKALYMQGVTDRGQLNILEEIASVASEENFDLYIFNDKKIIKPSEATVLPRFSSSRWAQDKKTFLKTREGKKIIWSSNEPSFNAEVKRFFADWKLEKDYVNPPGGNFFIGRNNKGKKWLLIGNDNVLPEGVRPSFMNAEKKTKLELSKIFDVRQENIFVLKQPNYHLDMSIRPVGYPYVLVDDPALALKNLESLEKEFPNDEKIEEMKKYLNTKIKTTDYAQVAETVKTLRSFGFQPIGIAGSYNKNINFMNAVVDLKDDGNLTYITNSTKYSTPSQEALMNMFKDDLTSRLPNINKIHFISGKNDAKYPNVNDMMTNLEIRFGGVHCMTAEVPDFDKMA